MRRRTSVLEPGGEPRCPGDDVPAVDGRCPRCGAELRALAAVQGLANTLYRMGVALARDGRLDEAAEQLSAALGLDPELKKARVSLGKVYARQGRVREARQLLEAVLATDPDDEEARAALRAVKGPPARAIAAGASLLALAALLPTLFLLQPWQGDEHSVDIEAARSAIASSEGIAQANIALSAEGDAIIATGLLSDETQRELLRALLRPFGSQIDDSGLVVRAEPPPEDLAAAVSTALKGDATTSSLQVAVSAIGQGVHVAGTVGSEDERTEVVRVARETPGVLLVDAEDLVVTGTRPTTYVVKPGDSLASIAARVYRDESLWRLIYDTNQAMLSSPSIIHPGTVLDLPPPPQ